MQQRKDTPPFPSCIIMFLKKLFLICSFSKIIPDWLFQNNNFHLCCKKISIMYVWRGAVVFRNVLHALYVNFLRIVTLAVFAEIGPGWSCSCLSFCRYYLLCDSNQTCFVLSIYGVRQDVVRIAVEVLWHFSCFFFLPSNVFQRVKIHYVG